MQTSKQQTASFPYLSQELSDYKHTNFKLEVKRGTKDKSVCFEATYDINNDEINELIRQQKVSVVVKLFCQPVGLNISKKIPHDAKNIIFFVNKMDVEKAVEFTAHLIVEESILYTNSDLSKEWANEEYLIEKYNDIGTSNKVTVPLEHRKEGKKSSIFQFQELTTLDALSPSYYSLNDDIIYFTVSRPVFRLYSKVQSRKYEAILTSFIIPSLTDILRQMINPGDELNEFNSEHEDKKWYKVITEKYKTILKKDPLSGEIEPYKAAQLLVKTPIHNMLAFVKGWVNNSGEGE